jgi:hypothetical protein
MWRQVTNYSTVYEIRKLFFLNDGPLSENLKSHGFPNFYKLSKPVEEEIGRKTLKKL